MTLAILLTGKISQPKADSAQLLRAKYGSENCVVVVSTWSDSNVEAIKQIIHPDILDIEEFSEVAPMLKKEVGAFACSLAEKPKQNSLAMWYKWARGRDICSKLGANLIAKTRMDVVHHDDFVLDAATEMPSIDEHCRIAIPAGGDHRGGMNDVLAVGRREEMFEYLSVWDNRRNLIKIAKWFHPETFLRCHLVNVHGMSVERFMLPISLPGLLYTSGPTTVGRDNRAYEPLSFRERLKLGRWQSVVYEWEEKYLPFPVVRKIKTFLFPPKPRTISRSARE